MQGSLRTIKRGDRVGNWLGRGKHGRAFLMIPYICRRKSVKRNVKLSKMEQEVGENWNYKWLGMALGMVEKCNGKSVLCTKLHEYARKGGI